jgi:phosphotriesterase-related protein
MDALAEPLRGQTLTVCGAIPAEEMGLTLAHEHLLARHQGPLVDTLDPVVAREELQRAVRWGARTVVDMSTVGVSGGSPLLVRRIAAEASVYVVLGTGYYKDAWLPSYVHDLSVQEMTEKMVADVEEGIEGTDVRAGVIGEIGVSRPTTVTEERVVAASARAQRRAGVAINVHFDIGGEAGEYNHVIDILEQEGADLQRVVLDHFICRPDELDLVSQLTSRGCLVEFDLWGQETWPKIIELTRGTDPEVQIASLAWFISGGMIDRLLISHDVANLVNTRTHGGFGQSHIMRNLFPRFREYGISDDQLRALMVDNPRRLFPIQ